MKLLKLALVLGITLLLSSACASRNDDANTAVQIEEFITPDSTLLANLSSVPVGSGRLLFSSPLLSRESREHYILEFRLIEDGSQLRLFSHMSSFKASDGFEILLTRSGEEIVVEASSPGRPQREITRIKIEGTSNFQRLRFEIHNGVPEGVRCLIWKDKLTYDGLTWTALDKVTEANSIFDSYESEPVFLSRGRGIYWGVELSKSELATARREAPYVR